MQPPDTDPCTRPSSRRAIQAPAGRGAEPQVRATVTDLLAKGGSHLGRLQEARMRGGRCPRDGAELLRRTIGGRTTYSCPRHQS